MLGQPYEMAKAATGLQASDFATLDGQITLPDIGYCGEGVGFRSPAGHCRRCF